MGRIQNVSSVAVIGAGVSGLAAAKQLQAIGLNATVFERSAHAGGLWVFDERKPFEPDYDPKKVKQASTADFDPEKSSETLQWTPDAADTLSLLHAPPGPCYRSLTNNVSTPQMKLQGQPWPTGTKDFVSHSVIGAYLQTTADQLEQGTIVLDTRVEKVRKIGSQWQIITSKLIKGRGLECSKQLFDAVVVASGHYHAPHIPDIPGLLELKHRYPLRVEHSKGYRDPSGFRDQNVLLIGGSVSAMDIAREVQPIGGQIYQSTRQGTYDLPGAYTSEQVTRIGSIVRFEVSASNSTLANRSEPLPMTAILEDGKSISDIHRVVICTGYVQTLPFLPQYHRDGVEAKDADPEALITDGLQKHNLHKDIWYIQDPTLAFIGASFHTATFSLFEFQAIALAASFAGIAELPSKEEMRQEYDARVKKKGHGKAFHSLRGEEPEYVRELVEWTNGHRTRYGLDAIEGHSSEWFEAYKVREKRAKERFELRRLEKPVNRLSAPA